MNERNKVSGQFKSTVLRSGVYELDGERWSMNEN
jgi:hypothetical protein